MSKKYSAEDYARKAELYARKAREMQTQEYAAIGELFEQLMGKIPLDEAEIFLRKALDNNAKYRWYRKTTDTVSRVQDSAEISTEGTDDGRIPENF